MPKAIPKPKTRPKPDKIKNLSELESLVKAARKAGHRVALCHGVFDLVHPGHIVHFRQAREHGDLVLVTVTPDRFVNKGPGRPIFNQQLRLETLAALEFVDFVALNEWPTATETIRLLKPDVYVKGSDYADRSADLTGRITEEEEAIRSVGGRLIFTDGFSSSSSFLINRFFSAYPEKTRDYLAKFRRRHSADEIVGHLRALSDLKVLVVGEAILDQYCYCLPVGKSPKETIVSTKFASEESFAGGAAATANHLAGFCGEVTLLSGVGGDRAEEGFFRSKLRPNVDFKPLRLQDRPTVRKRRFLEPAFMTKMFEIQYLDDSPIPRDVEEKFGAQLEALVRRHDLVVVNDFGHGFLTPRIRELLSTCGRFLALNTQANSANHGYNIITNYSRADYVAIDEPELRLASRSKYGETRELAAQMRRQLRCGLFLVSRGPNGCVVLADDGAQESPALATRIVDRTGAGDALFAVTSPCAMRRVPPEQLCFIGNCVGALAVEIVCNREPIDPVALFKFIQTLLK